MTLIFEYHTHSKNKRIYIYLGIWPQGKNNLPYHKFYAPKEGWEYSARQAKTVQKHFPSWKGENA